LVGREFDLLTYRHNWGEDRVYYHDDEGLLQAIPAGWTTAGPQDPFVVVSAGRSPFRIRDLMDLADLVGGLAR
jgi:hypothetical protein